MVIWSQLGIIRIPCGPFNFAIYSEDYNEYRTDNCSSGIVHARVGIGRATFLIRGQMSIEIACVDRRSGEQRAQRRKQSLDRDFLVPLVDLGISDALLRRAGSRKWPCLLSILLPRSIAFPESTQRISIGFFVSLCSNIDCFSLVSMMLWFRRIIFITNREFIDYIKSCIPILLKYFVTCRVIPVLSLHI